MGINFDNGRKYYVPRSHFDFASFEEESKWYNGLTVDLIEIDGVYFEETPERRQLWISKQEEAFRKRTEGRLTLELKFNFQFPYNPTITMMDGLP